MSTPVSIEIDNDYSNALSDVVTRSIRLIEQSHDVTSTSRELRELSFFLLGPPGSIFSQRAAGSRPVALGIGRMACSRVPIATHTQYGRRQR